jgi:hypothetical protein
MNMSPRWGEEPWRGTVAIDMSLLWSDERIGYHLAAFLFGCGFAALPLCGSSGHIRCTSTNATAVSRLCRSFIGTTQLRPAPQYSPN